MPGMPASSRRLAAVLLCAVPVACGPTADVSETVPENAAGADTNGAPSASDIVLRAADGVAVHGRLYQAAKPRATVLLFHQANGSAGEYATIAPRLAAAGYSALAIDQRSGGDLFGPNRTVAGVGRSSTFLETEPDLEAAFAWARERRLPVLVWGSSYSSALAFRLASRHPGEVAAVLAFSPGEYLDRPDAVRRAAARVSVPIFVSAASDAKERDSARAILAVAPADVEVAHLPETSGVHGSSTLIEARNPGGAETGWRAIRAFLDGL